MMVVVNPEGGGGGNPSYLSHTDGRTDRRRVIQIPPFLNFVETGDKNITGDTQHLNYQIHNCDIERLV